jgi:hypothetical protein
MNVSGLFRPTFKVTRNIEAYEHILDKAVSEINLLYFETNSRFKGLGKISSPTLVDYMGIYEEGDWWALTVIKVTDSNHLPKYLFLPLTTRNVSSVSFEEGTLPFDLGKAVFDLETHSETEGVFNMEMIDAFTDIHFYWKLINLFLPWKNIPSNHVNAYTTIHESGIGKFTFHSPQNFQLNRSYMSGVLPKLTNTGDMSLQYGDSYQLVLHKFLSDTDDINSLQSTPNLLGWITYSGLHLPELLIGTLLSRPLLTQFTDIFSGFHR